MITASQVKDLREKTGAGMMDCKKVLTETDGDMEKAIELLRERGIAKAAKKSDRVAAEGLVTAYVSEDGKVGAVAEVNAETDFVAKNDEFRAFANDVAKQVAVKNPKDVEELLAQTFINDEKIFYGICLNEEVESFKENLIFPEKGSQFMLLPKDALTNCDYLANQPIEFLYQLAFPLEYFFEDTEKCKHLKNFVFTQIDEKNNTFKIFKK